MFTRPETKVNILNYKKIIGKDLTKIRKISGSRHKRFTLVIQLISNLEKVFHQKN